MFQADFVCVCVNLSTSHKKATIHVCIADDFLRYVNGARAVCVCVCRDLHRQAEEKGNSVAGSRYRYVYLFESD